MARALLALGVLLVLAVPAAGLGATPAGAPGPAGGGHGLSGARPAPWPRASGAAGGEVDPIPRIGGMAVTTDDPAALRRLLRADRRVDFLEPVLTRHLSAEPAQDIDPDSGRPFGWAYDAVNAAGGLAAMGGGSSAAVAVLDSGVDVSHPDLAGRVGAGVDIQNGGTSVTDGVGHGTFIAGLISAIDGNGLGGRGVAGATPILPVRLTTNDNISTAAAAAGIVWAVDHGARVINLSFGGPGLSADRVERARLRAPARRAGRGGGGQQRQFQLRPQPAPVPGRRDRGDARRLERRPQRGRHDARRALRRPSPPSTTPSRSPPPARATGAAATASTPRSRATRT